MKDRIDYSQIMDIKYKHQEKIDVNAMGESCTDQWFNQTLSKVKESVMRLGIVEGDYFL